MGFIKDILKGLWEVISKPFKLIWLLLSTMFQPLLFVAWFVAALWSKIKEVVTVIFNQYTVFWTALVDAQQAAQAAMAAGWPSWMANGLGFVNQYFPVGETAIMLSVLIGTYIACTLGRIIKSCLPTFAS